MPVGRCSASLNVSGANEVLTNTSMLGWAAIHASSSLLKAVRWRCSSRLVLPLLQRRRIFRRSLSLMRASAMSTNRCKRGLSLARAKANAPAGTWQKWSILSVPW
ncbi:hypothetical protein D3C76_1177470 [compost metagenome]